MENNKFLRLAKKILWLFFAFFWTIQMASGETILQTSSGGVTFQINTIVKGKMRIDKKRTLTAGYYEKWQVISSHVCRRSFATNFYTRIPTAVLINITSHSSEQLFLRYIGRTTYDNAEQMLEYFSKLTPKPTNPEREVISNINEK